MNFEFLKKNDVVDIISPGTACTMAEMKKIEEFIHKIELLPNVFFGSETTLKKSVVHEFPSFDAKIRFAQFKKAVENPDSKIIWCTRGGYGSAELLPFLKKMPKPRNKKIFIGFSDIAALNKILIEDWSWEVITAPMLAQIALNKVSQKSARAIVDLIFGKISELKYKLITPNFAASAVVVGGCISVLAGSFGTKNQLNWHNKILFLEDEGEDGERLDRYFSQLVTIINEQKISPIAILLGNFMESNPHGAPRTKNILRAIEKLKKATSVPIIIEKSKTLGHSKNMMPLVLGAVANISADGILTQKF